MTRSAWPTWVLSNHDVPRHRTRYASGAQAVAAAGAPAHPPGTPFLYMGEELGLGCRVPADRVVDPGGRDGCRGRRCRGRAGPTRVGTDPLAPLRTRGDRPQRRAARLRSIDARALPSTAAPATGDTSAAAGALRAARRAQACCGTAGPSSGPAPGGRGGHQLHRGRRRRRRERRHPAGGTTLPGTVTTPGPGAGRGPHRGRRLTCRP